MKLVRGHLLIAAVALGMVLPTAPALADGGTGPYREYVSLGDSWSANVKLLDLNGLPDVRHAPIDCAQSQANYPKLLARELRVQVHKDATCGSATTEDFYAPQTGLPIGGNDAGISSAALSCLSAAPVSGPKGGCRERLTQGGVDTLARNIRKARPKLVRVIREVHRRSPRARILMVDYLAAVAPKGCYPRVPMTDSDMRYLHASFLRLNKMVRAAARIGGAEFVNTYRATVGHDVCQGPFKRYAEVLGVSLNGLSVGIPAHPNPAGAQAQFRAVLAKVRQR